ncbi:hypothetical protein JTB14_034994 [Gonioctena quinquepunctata]|nr:hypothetical protein JTB14_034994 [Gonioctena quinquepunctata]
MENITMDYQKNSPFPNITINDITSKRQLNYISFNAYIMSNSRSVFYIYDESEADEVCSMLNHFFHNILPMKVKELACLSAIAASSNEETQTGHQYARICFTQIPFMSLYTCSEFDKRIIKRNLRKKQELQKQKRTTPWSNPLQNGKMEGFARSDRIP